MASYENFYTGADYGLDPDYGELFLGFDYRFPSEQFGVPTDPRTSNQIKAVSDKIFTGVKTIEVSGVTPNVLENIPKQHLKEINRLKQLTGVDLTFHGPLIEPTGITRQGWDESQRVQAETQMWSALERSNELDPKGNVVVTFHSSNMSLEPETKVKDEKTGEEKVTHIYVVDKRTGQFSTVNLPPKDFLLNKVKDPYEHLKDQNEEAWYRQLQNVSFHAHNGSATINHVLQPKSRKMEPGLKEIYEKNPINKLYKQYIDGDLEKIKQAAGNPILGKIIEENMSEIAHGDIYLRDAYNSFQNLFNQAYDAALQNNKEEDRKKLDKFKEELTPLVGTIEDPENVHILAKKITEGVNVLRSIEPPKVLTPLRDFAIDKSSDTFANLALKSYERFKKNAPIISVENPPAGSGLARADDLRELIKKSREKFVERAMADPKLRLSEAEAKKQADKLLGVTWDVGHINMIKKFGYDDADVVKETERVAKFVKHVHLSDNFGLDHTELPMGMGNVPTKKMLDLISQYNKQAKKIAETGTWFGPQAFGTQTPLKQTFEAFGSPLYSMKMSPYWNQISSTSAGYPSSFGNMLPDIHFSTYGSGYSSLPPELGGQIGGRSRLSGNPME